ncbi:MAG: DNA-directed RNA polymerase subunit D [Ignisphaera sp.]|uniref:DNA-directed RNA polymerase subunit Rpo3 n=1 Tax=Ignisphaera aggregans TaxID=334771 RepID=A0A7C4NJU1_9CREN
MRLLVREHTDEAIELDVKGVPLAFLNTIRRYALAKVPTYAIDEVMIVVNTSSMFDEVLAHRLALIPLKTEDVIDKIRGIDPELCEKCASSTPEGVDPSICGECFVHMVLEVEATTNDITVYSSDIRSDDPYVVPAYANIPIVMLAPGQRIAIEMKARIGRGLEHAKWNPATIAVTKYVANIKVDEKLCNLCGKCIEVCPRGTLKIENGKLNVVDVYSCTLCRQCVKACPAKAIDVGSMEDEHIIRIESAGSLKPETIVREAVYILLNELSEFEKFIEGIGKGAIQ